MGAVVSCFRSILQAIGNVLTSIAHAIASIIYAIIDGILAIFDTIVSCLTCKRGSRGWKYRRSRRSGRTHHHTSAV